MNLDKLFQSVKNEPKYRASQVCQIVFRDFAESWHQATNLPKDLRSRLEKEVPLVIAGQIFGLENADSLKALITFSDGLKVECVLLKHKDERNTVCVSSQVGCSLNCAFCATGKMGFKRNLTKWEMVEQVLFFARFLKKQHQRVSNVVFMGMGEPFLNYENVLGAIRVLNDKSGFNIGARHISISTVGIVEGIKKLSREKLQLNLALSLHSLARREKLMPVEKTQPIKKVLEAVFDYINKTNRRVMIEYVLIKDINDSDKDALELARVLEGKLVFVNLINYNSTGVFKASERGAKFAEILESKKIKVTTRYKFGQDIHAACGQLCVKM